MTAELVFAPETELDIAEAYAWYERRRTGLGEEFMSALDACIESIRRQPQMFPGSRELSARPGTALSLRSVLRVRRNNGHRIRCVSYLSRPK